LTRLGKRTVLLFYSNIMSAKVAAKEVRNGLSSRVSFQYLDVDSGEEEEEEVEPSPDVAAVSLPPVKPPTM
jgi:hypothetical protein